MYIKNQKFDIGLLKKTKAGTLQFESIFIDDLDAPKVKEIAFIPGTNTLRV